MPHKSASYKLAETVGVASMSMLTRPRWEGLDNLPAQGGFIVASNHVSHADPITLGHALVSRGYVPRFLAKNELFTVPVLGRILRDAGQIPVQRESRNAGAAYQAAVQAVQDGEVLIVYPEGTVTRDPADWPMRGKTGVARLALTTGCRVVPVGQWGPQHLWAPNAKLPRLGRRRIPVSVRFGPVVDLAAYQGQATNPTALREATEAIMAAITGLVAQLRGEQPPTTRWDPRAYGQSVTGRFDEPPPPVA